MKPFLLFLVTFVLYACGGGSSSSGSASTVSALEHELAYIMSNPEERTYFANLIASHGVSGIGTMPPSATPPPAFAGGTVCGVTADKNILLNTSDPVCIRTYPFTITHEVAHYGTARTCPGHGKPYFDYFRMLAADYKQRFPNGSWRTPVADVNRQEQQYIDGGAYQC